MRPGPVAGVGMSTPITLQQIVNARKVLTAAEAKARKNKRSLAVVRALHGVLDEETLRLAATR